MILWPGPMAVNYEHRSNGQTCSRSLARTAGIFQVLEAVTATLGQVIILSKIIVSGNAAAIAANSLAHQRL
jgi:hypothetical protein